MIKQNFYGTEAASLPILNGFRATLKVKKPKVLSYKEKAVGRFTPLRNRGIEIQRNSIGNLPVLATKALVSRKEPEKGRKNIKHTKFKQKPVLEKPLKNSSLIDLKTDHYYFSNILKLNITQFNEILDSSLPYSYMGGVTKVIPTIYRKSTRTFSNNPECTCSHFPKSKRIGMIRILYSRTLRNTAILRHLPTLKNISFAPKENIVFPHKVVVLNAEHCLISKSPLFSDSNYYVRPRLVSSLQKLSEVFQIVLVYSENNKMIQDLLKFLSKNLIQFSSIYEVSRKKHSIRGVIDYSEIYFNFSIESPLSDVLIISPLLLPSDEIEARTGQRLITHRHGLYYSLLTEGTPFCRDETGPVSLLIPSLNSSQIHIAAASIVKLLLSIPLSDFSQLSYLQNIHWVTTSVVFACLLEKCASVVPEDLRGLEEHPFNVCQKHCLPAAESENFPLNKFAVLKPSNFPCSLPASVLK